MLGCRREELIGEPIAKMMPRRFRRAHIDRRAEYSAARHARPMGTDLELFSQCKDGREFPIEISLSPLATKEGTSF